MVNIPEEVAISVLTCRNERFLFTGEDESGPSNEPMVTLENTKEYVSLRCSLVAVWSPYL